MPVAGLSLDFEGAVIVVTGAGSGIGRAVALLLAESGARPVLVARRENTLREVADEIEKAGGESLVIAADIAEPTAPARIVAETVARFGRLDGLVNDAAIVRHYPLAEWSMDLFDEHLATNIRAPFFLIQAALPYLRTSPVAAVVNVSSSSGTLRRTGQSVYGMTKAALDYLTSSLAGELAPEGIRVNCVAPGPVDTPIHETWADDLEEAHRWLRSQVPLGRIGVPRELADWIVLLLSPLSSFVTGTVIPVDGGQVIDRE
jgi:meso-butanediol dehydrogenase/(S,S)-butanediol dehydrogenase/diacetyl reductase